MKRSVLLASLAATFTTQEVLACSCFGNNSYCEPLAPIWFVNPVSTVLAVKLTDYYYGITVKVVQVIGGEALPNDTLTVWGDNGALCRIGVNGFALGDTVVFGLNECELWGNSITAGFPPDLEQPEHYQVSVCGVYWLAYENGLVNGPITGPGVQLMDLPEYAQSIATCSQADSVGENGGEDPLVVSYFSGTPTISLAVPSNVSLRVIDARGRSAIARNWDGSPLPLDKEVPGFYSVEVCSERNRWIRKVVVGQ